MWNFETELSVRDCVRGVVVSNRAGVCHLLLETGESAVRTMEKNCLSASTVTIVWQHNAIKAKNKKQLHRKGEKYYG